MYHISLAQGQTQFFARENADPPWRRPSFPVRPIDGLRQLAATVGRRIAGVNQPSRTTGLDRRLDLVEPVGKVSRASRKTKAIQQPFVQQTLDLVRKIRRRDELGFCRPGERAAFGRLLDSLPRPGSLRPTSGVTCPSGPATKRTSAFSGNTSPDTRSRRCRDSSACVFGEVSSGVLGEGCFSLLRPVAR